MSNFWSALEQIKQGDARGLLRAVENQFDRALQQDDGGADGAATEDAKPAAEKSGDAAPASARAGAVNAFLGDVFDGAVSAVQGLVTAEPAGDYIYTDMGMVPNFVRPPDEPTLGGVSAAAAGVVLREKLSAAVSGASVGESVDESVNVKEEAETAAQGEAETAAAENDAPAGVVASGETESDKPVAENPKTLDPPQNEEPRELASARSEPFPVEKATLQLQRQLEAQQRQSADLLEEGHRLARENGTLTQRNRELAKTQKQLEGRLKSASDETQRLQQEIAAAANAREAQTAELRSAGRATQQALESEVAGLRATLRSWETAALDRSEQASAELQALQTRLQAAEAQRDEWRERALDAAEPLAVQLAGAQAQLAEALHRAGDAEDALGRALESVRAAQAQAAAAAEETRVARAAQASAENDAGIAAEQLSAARQALAAAQATAILQPPMTSDASVQTDAVDVTTSVECRTAGVQCSPMAEFSETAADVQTAATSPLPLDLNLGEGRHGELLLETRGAGNVGNAFRIQTDLTSRLARSEHACAALRSEVAALLQERDTHQEQIVELRGRVAQQTELESQLADLEKRHGAALELLGERSEQLEELQQDLAEARRVYREQLEELLARVPS